MNGQPRMVVTETDSPRAMRMEVELPSEWAVVWEGRVITGVRDGAGQADGFKWGGGVIELDEGFDAVGVGSSKGSVEGVETAVEAGA
eukprot:scaffold11497_cov122-Amphora_coffeaeformis.AAC.1